MHAHAHAAIPPDVVSRYRRVVELHTRATTPGERNAAKAAMDRIERSYPGVGAAAAVSRGPVGADTTDYAELFKVAFGAATEFFDWMHAGLGAAALRAQIEESIDDGIEIRAKPNRAGTKVAMIIEIDANIIDELLDLSESAPGARSLAAEIIGEKSREAFDALLVQLAGGEDSEP